MTNNVSTSFLAVIKPIKQRLIVRNPDQIEDQVLIKQVVHHALQNQEKSLTASTEPLLSITIHRTGESVSYNNNTDKTLLKVSLVGTSPDPISVVLFPMRDIKPPKPPELIGFTGLFCKLLVKWPIYIPGINLLWALVIAPLIALYQTCREAKVLENKALQAKVSDWERSTHNSSLTGTLAALKECVDLLGRKEGQSPKELELLNQTKRCLRYGTIVEESLRDGRPLSPIARQCAQEILESMGKQKTEDPLLMTVPSGYYREGTYYPMLLSFYRNEQNRLCLEKLTSDPEAEENRNPSRVYYTFPHDVDLEKLTKLLTSSWGQTKPLSTPKVKLQGLVNLPRAFEQNPESPDDVEKHPEMPPHELLSDLIAHCGGSLEIDFPDEKEGTEISGKYDFDTKVSSELSPNDARTLKRYPKRDHWNVLSHWIRHRFPQVPSKEKVLVAMDLISSHMETFLKKSETMKEKEKELFFQQIKKEMKKFTRVVNKAFGNDSGFDLLVEQDEDFAKINSKMTAVVKLIQQYEAQKSIKETAAAKLDFDKSASQSFGVTLATGGSAVDEGSTIKLNPMESYKCAASLEKLEKACNENTPESALAAKRLMTELVTVLEGLAKSKDWAQANYLAGKILEKLPVPLPRPSRDCFWNKVPIEQLDEWSEQITHATKCLWEAKHLQQQKFLWAEERVSLFNGRAILHKILCLLKEDAEEELSKRVDAITEEKEREEARKILNKYQQPFVELDNNRYRPHGINPHHHPTMKALADLACKLSVPYEKALYLSYKNVMPEYEIVRQYSYWEKFLPNVDPHLDAKLYKVIDYLHNEPKGKTLYLERAQDYSVLTPHVPDEFYQYRLNTIRVAYGGQPYRITHATLNAADEAEQDQLEYWRLNKTYYTQIRRTQDPRTLPNGEPRAILPSCIIDLRRHNLILQDSLSGAQDLTRHDTRLQDYKAYTSWRKDKAKEVKKRSKSTRDAYQLFFREQNDDVDQIIQRMGRLEFGVDSNDEFQQITILPASEPNDRLAKRGLIYLPNLNDDIRWEFFSRDNPPAPGSIRIATKSYISRIKPRGFQDHAMGEISPDLIAYTVAQNNIVNKNLQYHFNLRDRWFPYSFLTETAFASLSRSIEARPPTDHYLLSTLMVQGTTHIERPPPELSKDENIELATRKTLHEHAMKQYQEDLKKARSFFDDDTLEQVVELSDTTHYNHISPLEALDLICQRPDLLEVPENQGVLEMAFFRFNNLSLRLNMTMPVSGQGGRLSMTPQFFVERIERMHAIINHALSVGNIRTAAFMMHIGHHMREYAKMILAEAVSIPAIEKKEKKETEEKESKERDTTPRSSPLSLGVVVDESEKKRESSKPSNEELLQRMVEEMPCYTSTYQFTKTQRKPGHEILGRLSLSHSDDQSHIASFSLDWFYNHYQNFEALSDLPSDQLGTMLYQYSIVRNSGETSFAFMQKKCLDWIEYIAIPYLKVALPTDKMNEVLNSLYKKSTGQDFTGGNWVSAGEQSLTYASGGSSINLSLGLVKLSDEDRAVGPLIKIPQEIMRNAKYKKVFGEVSLKGNCVAGADPLSIIFNVKLENGQRFRLFYNKKTKDLTIDRFIQPPLHGGVPTGWYRLNLVQKKDHINASKLLKMHGVWKQLTGGREALLITKSPFDMISEDIFKVKLNRSLQVTEISQASQDPDREVVKICQDSIGRYTKWFPFVKPEEILVLRDTSSRKPTEIRLINQRLILRRCTNGKWQIQEGKYKGMYWVPNLASSSTSKTIKDFADLLEPFRAECMMTLQNGSDTSFVIWPYLFSNEPSKQIGTKSKLEFDKSSENAHGSLLHVSIGKDGRPLSSTAGFFYLAYLFSGKGDADRAHHYLERAVHTRLVNGEDRAQLKRIIDHLREQPRKTMRQIAFQLKAELALSRILQEQTTELEYNPEEVQEVLERSAQINSLYELYQAKMKEVGKTNPKMLIEKELELTDSEMLELIRIRTESHEFLPRSSYKGIGVERVPQPLATDVVSMNSPQTFGPYVIALMDDPEKIPSEHIRDVVELKVGNILSNFWGYCKQIEEERISPEQLQNLLVARFQSIDAPKEISEELKAAVESARNYLLALAAAVQNPSINTVKSEDIKLLDSKLKEAIPMTPWNDVELLKKLYKIKKSLPDETLPDDFSREHLSCIKKYFVMRKLAVLIRSDYDIKQLKVLKKMASAITDGQRIALETAEQKVKASKIHTEKPRKSASDFEASRLRQMVLRIKENETRIKIDSDRAGESKLKSSDSRSPLLSPNIILPSIGEFAPLALFKSQDVQRQQERLQSDARELRAMFAPKSEKESKEAEAKDKEAPKKDPMSAMEAHENAQLVDGIDIAEEKMKKEFEVAKTITGRNTQALSTQIEARSKVLEKQTKEIQEVLLKWAASKDAPHVLNQMSKKRDIHGDGAIMRSMLNLYQRGQLKRGAFEDCPVQVDQLTQFLILSTEHQQLQKAQKELLELEKTQKQIYKTTGEVRRGYQLEYDNCANKIYKIIEAAINQKRYLEKDGSLKTPLICRKYLVAEYRAKIILREEQLKLIEQIMKEPQMLAQLRMGLGKTTTIMPLLLELFSQQNTLVVGIVTEELLQMNLETLDEYSRELFEHASFKFNFDINNPDSPACLAEQYNLILTAKAKQGYILTTVTRLAALENKLTLIADKLASLSEKMDRFILAGDSTSEEFLKVSQQLKHFADQDLWLRRIKSIYDGDTEKLGFKVHFIADEGDDIFSARKQVNLALPENMRKPDIHIRNAGNMIMTALFQDPSSRSFKLPLAEEECLKQFRNALLNNKHASMSVSARTAALNALQKIMHHQIFSRSDAANIEEILAPVEYILTQTLPSILKLNLGIDLKLSNTNGCVVVPCHQKTERPHTQFGEECELILNHMLQYVVYGPSNLFLAQCLTRLPSLNPERYQAILKEASKMGLKAADYLRTPEAIDHRLYILNEFVIEAGYLEIPKEHITLNVHDVIRKRPCTILSGTMNPSCLPASLTANYDAKSARAVEMETVFRIMLGEQAVKIFDDDRLIESMREGLKKPNLKAIINQGVSPKDMDTLQIVAQLRKVDNESSAIRNRQFIFIHPEKRTQHMWLPKDSEPIPYDSSKYDSSTAVFYYDPADTRGVDLKLPPCEILLLTGATTILSESSQAAYRARDVGPIQRIAPCILASVAERIKEEQLKKGEEIELKHIINDFKKKTLEGQAMLNYKTAVQDIRGIAFSGMRKIRFANRHDWNIPVVEDTSRLSLQRMTAIKADAFIFRISRSMMIHEKKVDFMKALQPSEKEPTLSQLNKIYDGEIARLKVIYKQLADEKKNAGRPWIDHGYIGMIESAMKEVDGIFTELEASYEKFNKTHSELQKSLPLEVDSNDFGTSSTLVDTQVQQEQRQLQQQHELAQQITAKPKTKAAPIPYTKPKLPMLVNDEPEDFEKGAIYPMIKASTEKPALVPGLYMTEEVMHLMKELPSLHQMPFAKLLIVKTPLAKRYRLCLIGKNDYYSAFRHESYGHRNSSHCAVYSIDTWSHIDPKKPVGLILDETHVEEPDLTDPELIQQIAMIRLLSGATNFTEREHEALMKTRLPREDYLTMEAMLNQRGSLKSLEILQKMAATTS